MIKQRPWGWIVWRAMAEPEIERCKPKDGDYVLCEPLYTAPPARKPLTEPELNAIEPTWPNEWNYDDVLAFVRAIERAHGIGDE